MTKTRSRLFTNAHQIDDRTNALVKVLEKGL